jgi:hypothetical protein
MISLILVVCLSATPDICREEPSRVEITTPMVCLIQGQQIAAEWIEEHPKWRLQGWRCQFGQQRRKDI